MRLTWTTLALTSALLAAGPARDQQARVWREITGPPVLTFPRDHGAHPDTRVEWWYLTGLVEAKNGHRYGFQITFFRQGLAPGPPAPGASDLRARQIAAAHLAIADVNAQRFDHAERVRRAGEGLAGWSDADLDVWLETWTLRRGADGAIIVRARDAATDIGLYIRARPDKPIVRNGDGGYSQKGPEPGNASVYLSWTQLAVAGRIEMGGAMQAVTGAAWFDHEWGTSQLGRGIAGWDWFGLRLDDGRDLLVYRLRRDDGTADRFSSGTLVGADGATTHIERDDIHITPLAWWTSPSTGGRYPIRWRLRVATRGIDVEISALLPSCELDGRATTGVIYWEGPVTVTGSAHGEGYAELTGYAGSLAGRF